MTLDVHQILVPEVRKNACTALTGCFRNPIATINRDPALIVVVIQLVRGRFWRLWRCLREVKLRDAKKRKMRVFEKKNRDDVRHWANGGGKRYESHTGLKFISHSKQKNS